MYGGRKVLKRPASCVSMPSPAVLFVRTLILLRNRILEAAETARSARPRQPAHAVWVRACVLHALGRTPWSCWRPARSCRRCRRMARRRRAWASQRTARRRTAMHHFRRGSRPSRCTPRPGPRARWPADGAERKREAFRSDPEQRSKHTAEACSSKRLVGSLVTSGPGGGGGDRRRGGRPLTRCIIHESSVYL